MSSTEILVIVALTIYAIYKQSVWHEVTGKSRFKLAPIYAAGTAAPAASP